MRVAVNGFGRIGRDVVRILTQNDIKELDLVAVNFSGDLSLNAHLFKHDSIYGKFNGEVTAKEKSLVINGKEIVVPSNRAPEQLPWKDLEIDLVIDSTGAFKDVESLSKHLMDRRLHRPEGRGHGGPFPGDSRGCPYGSARQSGPCARPSAACPVPADSTLQPARRCAGNMTRCLSA